MKNFLSYIFIGSVFVMGLMACHKAEDLPYYETGNASQLSASTATINVTEANALQDLVTFNWTDPGFATDTSNYKYVVEIAPKGTNFANPVSYTVNTAKSLSVTGTDINNMLIKWGANYGAATDLEVRVKSSYANNNDMKISEVINIKASAYAVPFTLSATATGPFAPTPQTKDDILTTLSWTAPDYGSSTITYSLEYVKTGTGFASPNVITLQVPDSLQKSLTAMELYQMANTAAIALNTTGSVDVRVKATVNGTGQVSYSNPETLMISPVEMTLYLYVAGGFQSAEPYKKHLPADNNWGWDPATAPKLASTDGVNYEGYIWVPADVDRGFKFVKGPDWSYGDNGGSSGQTITVDGKNYTGGYLNSGDNLMWPSTGKYYLVKVNMNDKSWYVFETTWGLIGAATPGGWDNSSPMTYDITLGQFGKWKAATTFTSGEFKFRANNGWDINLGGSTNLTYGGSNITISAGTKTVLLDLSDPLKYTYTIQ